MSESVQGVIDELLSKTAEFRENNPGFCTQVVSARPTGSPFFDPATHLPWVIPLKVELRAGNQYTTGGGSVRTATPFVPPKELGQPSSCSGNPINNSNGNKFQSALDTDEENSKGPRFERLYNSAPLFINSSLGWGWSHTYMHRIKATADHATVIFPDGKIVVFSRQGSVWKSDGDVAMRLAQEVDESGNSSGWRLIDPASGSVASFSANGALAEVRSLTGDVLEISFSLSPEEGGDGHSGTLDRVSDQFGRSLLFQNDSELQITGVTRSGTQQIGFGYSGSNLRTVTHPARGLTEYSYGESEQTENGNLPHALTGITIEGVRFATFGYQASGRAVSTEHAGMTERYELDYLPDGTTKEKDPLGTERIYSFETVQGVRRPTGVSQPGGPGCGASSSAITYDINANIASRTDFAGSKTCYGSDLTRNLETVRIEGLGSADACPASPAGYSPTVSQRKTSTEWHPVWRLKVREAQPNKITTWVYHGQPDPTAGGAIASCAPSDAYVYDTEPIAVLCKQVEQATTDTTGGAGFGATASGAPRIWTYTWNRHGQMLTANGPRTDVADVTTYE